MIAVWIGVGWLALSVPVAVGIGRGIRIADERRAASERRHPRAVS